jgi:alpha-tubulin suppressor-like RCC1 family protein
VPAPLGLTGVRQVVTGYSQSAVLLTDGSMWTWGSNFAGEQGTGVPDAFTTVPAKVPGLTDLARLALGFGFDLVIAAPRQPLVSLVPDLTGATAADAQDRLRDAGLFGQHPRSGPCGRVVAQDPAAGGE